VSSLLADAESFCDLDRGQDWIGRLFENSPKLCVETTIGFCHAHILDC